MRRIVAFLLTVLVLSAPFCAGADYPVLKYYVNDQAGALQDYEEFGIEELCISVYEQKGAEMVVLIVNNTQPDDINLFATRTFQQNQLGEKGEDNGLLLVISTDEKLWRIEVGYGLEGVLPDSLVGNMSETYLVPPMSYGDYYTGIYDVINNIGGEILENYVGEPPKNPYPISFIPLTFWQLVIVIVIMVFLTVITKGRIFFFLPYLIGKGGGGRSGGGGRTGGGGAGGRWK
jgi:uncharacterized protein